MVSTAPFPAAGAGSTLSGMVLLEAHTVYISNSNHACYVAVQAAEVATFKSGCVGKPSRRLVRNLIPSLSLRWHWQGLILAFPLVLIISNVK